MALTPNIDFVTGAILTAEQQNRLPRGGMTFTAATVTDATVTAEEIQITSASFTADADRTYRLTYSEPQVISSLAGVMILRMRFTNLAGALIGQASVTVAVAQQSGVAVAVRTLPAGATVVVATAQCTAGTGQCQRSAAGIGAYLLIEDIGGT